VLKVPLVYFPQVGYVCIESLDFVCKGPIAAQEPRQGKERDKYDSSSEPEMEPKHHDLDTWRDQANLPFWRWLRIDAFGVAILDVPLH